MLAGAPTTKDRAFGEREAARGRVTCQTTTQEEHHRLQPQPHPLREIQSFQARRYPISNEVMTRFLNYQMHLDHLQDKQHQLFRPQNRTPQWVQMDMPPTDRSSLDIATNP